MTSAVNYDRRSLGAARRAPVLGPAGYLVQIETQDFEGISSLRWVAHWQDGNIVDYTDYRRNAKPLTQSEAKYLKDYVASSYRYVFPADAARVNVTIVPVGKIV